MKSSILDQIIRSVAIVKKDVMIYYSKGPVVLMGVLWPAIMFISFAFGRGMAIENLIPGVIGVSVFFSCSVRLVPSIKLKNSTVSSNVSSRPS